MTKRDTSPIVFTENLRARRSAMLNRLHARLSGLSRPATGFISQPEPRSIGSFARGKQLISGNFLFAGSLIEKPDTLIWDLPMPDAAFEEEVHGFAWLDDLAAVGDAAARKRAHSWLAGWIKHYGRGSGPGWTPDLTGRRLIRWVNHALMLLNGQDKAVAKAYFRSLAQQVNFLGKRWRAASPGLPRFEALTGLIYAGLALTGLDRQVGPAIKALAQECASQIDSEGGIPTRNPEELLEVFTLLTWAQNALNEAGRVTPNEVLLAIERIAPTLRALRHSDGSLARFHGGGRGAEGRLDEALANSGIRTAASAGLSMGYLRMSANRTSVILDASRPPDVECSSKAHASTLAFEMTSGRRPLIVNCGPGATFGSDWRQAARATPLHSTLCIEGMSSSRLGPTRSVAGHKTEFLIDQPQHVGVEASSKNGGQMVSAWHDGYLVSHGLTHVRRMSLSPDGRIFSGEDALSAMSEKGRRTFDERMNRTALQSGAFTVRFHVHPDVETNLDMGGTAVSLALKSGEVWVFGHDGSAELSLEASVYLQRGRVMPRATKQIVLSSRVMDYSKLVGWTFSKAQETPSNLRDFEFDELKLT